MCVDHAPVLASADPLFRSIHHCQIQHLQKTVIGGKYGLYLCHFPALAVESFNGMGFTVIPFGQGFKDMSPPTKELMKLTLEQKLVYGGQPILRWMKDNSFIRTDPAGNIKPDKEKSTEKIDGAVATIMALDRALYGTVTIRAKSFMTHADS